MAGKRCPKCNRAAAKAAKFCKDCGLAFETEETGYLAFGDDAISVLESFPSGGGAMHAAGELSGGEAPEKAALDPHHPIVPPEAVDGTDPAPVSGREGATTVLARHTLTILNGAERGTTIELKSGDTLLIGSGPEAGLRLAGDAYLSRRHARLESTGGELRVYDEGSSNGTFVSVRHSHPLQDGEVVLAGQTRIEVRRVE
jgi:hypothetical protein